MKRFSLLLVVLQFSCAVMPDIAIRDKDTSAVELGLVGSVKTEESATHFKVAAIPEIKDRVRVVLREAYFDKSELKKYNKAQSDKDLHLEWDDSLSILPPYVDLELSDKVSWLNELNGKHNTDLFDYLKSANQPVVISAVSLCFPSNLHAELLAAEEVYLVNNERKKYLLELYSDQLKTTTVEMSSGLLFDYETNQFCWTEDKKHDIVIADINASGCERPMYVTYQKAVKKKSEFKF